MLRNIIVDGSIFDGIIRSANSGAAINFSCQSKLKHPIISHRHGLTLVTQRDWTDRVDDVDVAQGLGTKAGCCVKRK